MNATTISSPRPSITRPRIVRSTEPLSDEVLRIAAPSVFAEGAHQSRSARYSFIPNAPVLDALRSAGYHPIEVAAGGSRIAGKEAYTKHLIRFRHADHLGASRLLAPEIVMVNSHDGTSSYQMMAGIFRMVCSNGMIVGESAVPAIKVPHKGDVAERVVQAADAVIDQTGRVFGTIETWRCRMMTSTDISRFAKAANSLRFSDDRVPWSIVCNRFEDGEPTLWHIFNRAQENLVNGGPERQIVAQDGRIQWRKVRPIRNVNGLLHLNRRLWDIADRLCKGEEDLLALPS
jgi:hypothetical protein